MASMPSLDSHSLEAFMREALVEAATAGAHGDFPIGAVLVIDGSIVSRGRAHRQQVRSKLAHAELQALLAGGELLWTNHHRAVLMTTVEPCPLCLGATVMADVPHIVFGAYDHHVQSARIVSSIPYVRAHIATYLGGVLEDECRDVIARYAPHVLLSMDERYGSHVPYDRGEIR